VEEFVRRATAMHLPFDFVSSHMYPTDPQCPSGTDWGPDCLPRRVRALKQKLSQHPASATVPFYLTEYNAGCGVGYPQHDGPGAAAFAFRTIGELDGVTALLSWWTFSDVFEEGTPIDQHSEYMNVSV
jgi:xylan 1,4-beta-xylosidase